MIVWLVGRGKDAVRNELPKVRVVLKMLEEVAGVGNHADHGVLESLVKLNSRILQVHSPDQAVRRVEKLSPPETMFKNRVCYFSPI